jgi:ubiquitin-activating enzyme E1
VSGLPIDRPHATQIRLNTFCRQTGTKFVSIETAGVYGKAFCDFGPDFQVYDADGETPSKCHCNDWKLSTDQIRAHCVDGEKHDVSAGDTIEFRDGNRRRHPRVYMSGLARLEEPIKVPGGGSESHTDCGGNVQHPKWQTLPRFDASKYRPPWKFSPLESILQEAHSSDSSLFAIRDLDKCFPMLNDEELFPPSFQVLGAFRRAEW